MRSLVCGVVPVRKMGKALQCGFLGMIFLASGSSALQCHSLNYIWTAFYKGHVAESVVLATYRGCADKEDKDGQGHVTTDKSNPHFNMQYNASYCSTDLCNNKMSTDYALNLNPGENTAPEKSGSNHCYAAITSDSKRNPKRVTCSKGYDQCYSGNANVTVGFISPIVIKTCSRPNFTESQNLSFGPIKFNLLGSSCLGSYCNGPKPDVTSHGK